MSIVGRPLFAFESIGQVLDRAESESSWSSGASDDSSRQSLSSGKSRPSSMKPSKKDRRVSDSRRLLSVRFEDEVVAMGADEASEKGEIPPSEGAIVPVQKQAMVGEVGPIFRPLPISLWELWESQARFAALVQAQNQQMLYLPPWAVMQNPWMMSSPQTMMMMTPMMTPLGQFANYHPTFNASTTHGMAMAVAQQTYQTTFTQQLLRFTCPGPGAVLGPPGMTMMPVPCYGLGWSNFYGPQPFPLLPAPVYGQK